MANYARCGFALVIMLGIVCGQTLGALEDADRNTLGLNLPYGRGLVSSSSREIRIEFGKDGWVNSGVSNNVASLLSLFRNNVERFCAVEDGRIDVTPTRIGNTT